MVPETDRPSLGFLLRGVYDALAAEVYGRLPEAGFGDIRPAHSAVFRYVSKAGARAVDLAARAGMTKQSMGYLLDDLHSLGYIAFEADPSDGRARLARLTTRGVEAKEALERLSAEVEDRWASAVGVEEWGRVRQVLEEVLG